MGATDRVIGDDVDLASRWLGGHYVSKKVDKLGAGMALSGLAKDFAALGIEGSVKGKGSMAVILKTMGFGSAWRRAEQDPDGPRLGERSFRSRKKWRHDQDG
jgi:hypothetical protein